jgi:hypothetical protein
MGNEKSDDDGADIDEIIYKGVVPTEPGEHDSFFGSNPEMEQHFTVHEGQKYVQEED